MKKKIESQEWFSVLTDRIESSDGEEKLKNEKYNVWIKQYFLRIKIFQQVLTPEVLINYSEHSICQGNFATFSAMISTRHFENWMQHFTAFSEFHDNW